MRLLSRPAFSSLNPNTVFTVCLQLTNLKGASLSRSQPGARVIVRQVSHNLLMQLFVITLPSLGNDATHTPHAHKPQPSTTTHQPLKHKTSSIKLYPSIYCPTIPITQNNVHLT